ncbi:hypothetical protein A2U01_0054512, partial [Trifolium medium]|nr:hypothetical protein [Trifolium medium]
MSWWSSKNDGGVAMMVNGDEVEQNDGDGAMIVMRRNKTMVLVVVSVFVESESLKY